MEKQTTLLKKLMNEFMAEIPIDAVQKKTYGDKAEGYKIGYLIERLNTVTTSNGCTWEYKILPMVETPNETKYYLLSSFSVGDTGKKKETVAIRLRFFIKDSSGNIVLTRESFGGCQVINNSLGDTLKGAQTDAFKKLLSYLGIGNAAFKGRLDAQLRSYNYWRDGITTKLREYLTRVNESKPTLTLAMGTISDICEKHYENFDNVLYEDWVIVNDFLDYKINEMETPKKVKNKKKATNEQTGKDGENTPKATAEKVDKQL